MFQIPAPGTDGHLKPRAQEELRRKYTPALCMHLRSLEDFTGKHMHLTVFFDFFQVLIKEGAKVNVRNWKGVTPLQYASSRGNLKTVQVAHIVSLLTFSAMAHSSC